MLSCPKCNQKAPYVITKHRVVESVLNGKKVFSYMKTVAHCQVCGEALDIPWVREVNEKSRAYAFVRSGNRKKI